MTASSMTNPAALNLRVPPIPYDSWWVLGVVLVLLIVSIWLIARLTTSVTEETDPAEIDRQMLSAVRELHSEGELTPEEFRSIKSQLVQRLAIHDARLSSVKPGRQQSASLPAEAVQPSDPEESTKPIDETESESQAT
ncbi:MAG: hypothetical protein R3C49_12855 [Planctomycetaceae bacterium]